MENHTTEMLNVTLLEPGLRHPTIFERFDALPEGESLVILNDHDPRPLYYQMLGERGNVFTWQYLEEGPEWWRVSITKKEVQRDDETVGSLVAADFRRAEVFKKYGIDFCCGGKKTVAQACKEKNIDPASVEQELMKIPDLNKELSLPYHEWAPDFLADYIVQTHHRYVGKTLPQLLEYAQKVRSAHGADHPELQEIETTLHEVDSEMRAHMMKEERVLFPYIKAICSNQDGGIQQQAHFGTVQNPINMMEMEHEVVGTLLERIRLLSTDYTFPETACNTWRVFYRMLQQFENDLHVHVHLENNILFPQAVKLERQLHLN
ncbi:MAG: iron-sulfur cluster repair di-iron protein [Chitinophagaceae bacterium]|nr:iron-sulfur cluster repair di-iron protein [Chitinophagaceae bacterium]